MACTVQKVFIVYIVALYNNKVIHSLPKSIEFQKSRLLTVDLILVALIPIVFFGSIIIQFFDFLGNLVFNFNR